MLQPSTAKYTCLTLCAIAVFVISALALLVFALGLRAALVLAVGFVSLVVILMVRDLITDHAKPHQRMREPRQ